MLVGRRAPGANIQAQHPVAAHAHPRLPVSRRTSRPLPGHVTAAVGGRCRPWATWLVSFRLRMTTRGVCMRIKLLLTLGAVGRRRRCPRRRAALRRRRRIGQQARRHRRLADFDLNNTSWKACWWASGRSRFWRSRPTTWTSAATPHSTSAAPARRTSTPRRSPPMRSAFCPCRSRSWTSTARRGLRTGGLHHGHEPGSRRLLSLLR